MNGNGRLLAIGCLSYLITGFTHVVIGAVLPMLMDYYGRGYEDGGNLVFSQFLGFLIGVLCMPMLNARWGRRTCLMLALGCMGAAECVIAFLPSWFAVVGLAFVAGFGFGLVEACVGTLVMRAIKDRQAIAMSRLEVFFGVGALVMPFISGVLIRYGLWTYSFAALGVASFLTLAMWKFLSFGERIDVFLATPDAADAAAKQAKTGYGSHWPILVSFAVVFFLYVGSEVCVINFVPSILIEKLGVDASTGTVSVTVFWAAMVVGRLFAGNVAEKAGYRLYLLVSCFGSALVLAALAFTGQLWLAFTILMLLGLFMAGLFAIALLQANRLLPGTTERTTSILVAAGGLGGALMPLAMGRIMAGLSAEWAVWALGGAMLALTVLTGIWRSRSGAVPGQA